MADAVEGTSSPVDASCRCVVGCPGAHGRCATRAPTSQRLGACAPCSRGGGAHAGPEQAQASPTMCRQRAGLYWFRGFAKRAALHRFSPSTPISASCPCVNPGFSSFARMAALYCVSPLPPISASCSCVNPGCRGFARMAALHSSAHQCKLHLVPAPQLEQLRAAPVSSRGAAAVAGWRRAWAGARKSSTAVAPG